MDTKARIEAGKHKVNNMEKAKVAAETQLTAAEKQKAEIVDEMTKDKVTPDTIEAEIAKEEAAAQDAVEKAEKLLSPQA